MVARIKRPLAAASAVAAALVGLWLVPVSSRAAGTLTATTPPGIQLPAGAPSTPYYGETLTETAATGWTGGSGSYTITYQWQDCSGGTCVNATGPGSTTQSYTLQASDVGKTMVVQETATDTTDSTVTGTASSAATPVVAAAVNNSLPTITGTPQDGQKLNEGNGSWTPTPNSYTYQWQRCSGGTCTSISGATAKSYTLTSSDVGDTIVVQESAIDGGGTAGPVSSAQTTAVLPPPPTNSTPPTISGTAQDGQALTETNGTWTNTNFSAYPVTYTYQWQRCNSSGGNCSAVSGATNQTYTVSASDLGSTIRVEEWASTAGGKGGPAQSAATAVVVPPPPSSVSPPTISGTPTQGQPLTESHGAWTNSPTSWSYQWEACDAFGNNCNPIAGATGQTYTPTAANVGSTLVVQETATNAGGSGGPATSSPTVAVTPPPPPGNASSTIGLLTLPSAPVANQPVTMVAVVTSSDGAVPPSGTITFENGQTPISGCTNQPVNPGGQSVTVNCQTSFPAGAPQLTATFTPTAGLNMTGATSSTDALAVGRDSSTTVLDASGTVNAGTSTTYTATVSPPASRPGPIEPSGSVKFLDNGQPIAGCLNQPLSTGGATCTVTYQAAGTHNISAQYTGDNNFTGSAATAKVVTVVAVPVHVPGRITSTMQWEFYYTPDYTTVLSLVVNGASGATVSTRCQGRGCPAAAAAVVVPATRRCGTKAKKRACPTLGRVNLTGRFRHRRLYVGTRIIVTITRRGWIGKHYVFTMRSRHGPRVTITCLAPGSTRPGARC